MIDSCIENNKSAMCGNLKYPNMDKPRGDKLLSQVSISCPDSSGMLVHSLGEYKELLLNYEQKNQKTAR